MWGSGRGIEALRLTGEAFFDLVLAGYRLNNSIQYTFLLIYRSKPVRKYAWELYQSGFLCVFLRDFKV